MKIITAFLICTLIASCSASSIGPTASQIEATISAGVSATLAALPGPISQATNLPEPTSTAQPTATARPTQPPRPTNTPRPTSTPEPEIGTRQNPHPFGSIADLVYTSNDLQFQMTIADVKRGKAAWNIIYAANQFNDKPPEGMEYIVATVVITYTGADKGPLQMDRRDWAVVTNGQVFSYSNIPTVCCLTNELEDITVFSGGKAKGIMAWPVYVDDPAPLLVAGIHSDGTGGVYFATTP